MTEKMHENLIGYGHDLTLTGDDLYVILHAIKILKDNKKEWQKVVVHKKNLIELEKRLHSQYMSGGTL